MRTGEIVHRLGWCVYDFLGRRLGGSVVDEGLDGLPVVFTYADARRYGLSEWKLYALRDRGDIDVLGRGLFRRSDPAVDVDVDLVEVASPAPEATLRLAS